MGCAQLNPGDLSGLGFGGGGGGSEWRGEEKRGPRLGWSCCCTRDVHRGGGGGVGERANGDAVPCFASWGRRSVHKTQARTASERGRSARSSMLTATASRSNVVCLFGNILPGGKNYMQEKIDLKKRQSTQENKPSQSSPQEQVDGSQDRERHGWPYSSAVTVGEELHELLMLAFQALLSVDGGECRDWFRLKGALRVSVQFCRKAPRLPSLSAVQKARRKSWRCLRIATFWTLQMKRLVNPESAGQRAYMSIEESLARMLWNARNYPGDRPAVLVSIWNLRSLRGPSSRWCRRHERYRGCQLYA